MLNRVEKLIPAFVLWSIWALSALQPVVLAIEFWDLELKDCGYEAWYYARLYSHMFLYPFTFGLVSTIFLHRPLIEGIDYLHRLSKPERRKKSAVIVVSVALIVGVASYAEFSQATQAIWAFSPKTLSKYEPGIKARNFLENRCKETELTGNQGGKVSFSDLMKELEKESDSHSWIKIHSWTEIAYHLGFPSMFSLFIILFVTISIASTTPEDVRQRMMPRLTYALLFASFWVLMRFAFLAEKFSIFNKEDDRLLLFNGLIFLAFLVVYKIYLRTFRMDRLNNMLVDTMFSLMTTINVLFFGEFWIPISLPNWIPDIRMTDILIRLFGTQSDELTYLFIFLFLLLVFFPHILRSSS